jgi:hypothetical protein
LAEGAIKGLWLVWWGGHKIVSLIHDQIVVELSDDNHVGNRKAEIKRFMKHGMEVVTPGIRRAVESDVRF